MYHLMKWQTLADPLLPLAPNRGQLSLQIYSIGLQPITIHIKALDFCTSE